MLVWTIWKGLKLRILKISLMSSNKNANNGSGRRRNTAGKTHILPPLNVNSNNKNQLVSNSLVIDR